MARKYGKDRRESTVIRDNYVHGIYYELAKEIGSLVNVVSKSYIYDYIGKKTGLCAKTIAYILNHTRWDEKPFNVK